MSPTSSFIYELWSNICPKVIREGDIGEKLFPDFPDMKVDFAEIGIGKTHKIWNTKIESN